MSATNPDTLADLLLGSAEEHSPRIALRAKEDGEWVSYTYGELEELSRQFALGLIELGIKKEGEFGDRVVVLTENRPEFVIADLALKQIGAITSPAHKEYTANEVRYNLNDSMAKAIVVSTEAHLDKVLAHQPEGLPHLEHIILTDPHTLSPSAAAAAAKDERVIAMHDVIGSAKSKETYSELERRKANLSLDDVVTLIYTSGTTSNPKGVMQTNRYIIAAVAMVDEVITIPDPYITLSILPLPHAFGYIADYLLPFIKGGTVIYSTKEELKENFGLWTPTNMNTAPKLFERIQSGLRAKGGGIIGGVLENGIQAVIKNPDSRWAKITERIGASATGGNLDYFISGSAALDPGLFDWIGALGLEICNAYGMTEALPISINPPGSGNRTREGSVGRILSMWDVMIDQTLDAEGKPRLSPTGEPMGEIVASSAAIMDGYWNKPEKTQEVLEERDGRMYMHTGDLGYVREFEVEGRKIPYLYIVGRLKDEIVLTTGKNITPGETEEIIMRIPGIVQALVHGSQKEYLGTGEQGRPYNECGRDRSYITALIAPSDESLLEAAKDVGVASDDLDALLENKSVLDYYRELVAEQVEVCSVYMRPKDIRLIREVTEDDLWNVDGEEKSPLTPTLKLKRPIVQTYYREKIDSMYEGD